MEKTSFEGDSQIDKVVSSLNAFKKAVYDVNYLIKIVRQNTEAIINAGEYNSIIAPIINRKYSKVRLCIFSIATDNLKWDEGKCYYSFVNPEWSNKNLNDPSNFIYNPNILVSGAPKELYKLLNMFIDDNINYLNRMINKNPNNKVFYQFTIHDWVEGPYIALRCIQPDILDNTKWIQITTLVMLNEFFPNAVKLTTFSPEYIQFVNIVSKLIEELEYKNWNNSELIENIWEYSNISNIDDTKCLYSKTFPEWNGKIITDCFIPNSNIDVQSNMSQLFNDLYFYYPSLTVGELAFSTYNINGKNILSICKIDTYNGVQCIKDVKLDLAKLFKQNNIIGDTILNGKIQINDRNGDSVIETDNVTKNISIHGKVGINQDLHEIKALLDIDNLSNENILTIVDKIADLNNTSYNVVDEIKNSILNNGTFTISPDYTNDVVVFKIPILNKIQVNNISFLHKPSNIFKTDKFSNDSFLKIQLIINEINKMNVEIDNYNTQEGDKLVMSFLELLNDTEYYYVCSLKAIFKNLDIYFVMSFTLVQNIMVDNSYKKIFTNLINAFSSLNRLVNYSILVVELREIYDKLIEGDSVNSFTKYVQESEFSDRFGLKHPTFIWSNQHFTGNILDINNIGNYLFAEDYPQWNLKFLKDVIIPNSDRTISEVHLKVMSYYQDKYGLYKKSQNFIVHYLFDDGEKITFLNKIMIKGNEYFIGSGINLIDYIDLNISSTGDNKITGNLYVKDENNSNVFSVDTEYNKITNMYKTGFGTEYPKTIIDVNDSGLTDIINIIKDMANKEHALNLNIGFIKNLNVMNAANIDDCINTQFKHPNTGNTYIQNKDDYFYCEVHSIDNNLDEIKNIYRWLYRNWDDTNFVNIDDKNATKIKDNYANDLLNEFKTQYSYDNLQSICTSDWTFGMKFRSRRLFKNNTDNKTYQFGNGLNIGNYNLKINNNGNISTFFDYIKYMNLYLQNFIIRLNNIDTNSIPNYKSVNDYFSIVSNVVSPKQFTLKKIVVDFTNFKNTKVYDIDFDTRLASGNEFDKTIYQIQNVNERNRYLLMLTNIKSIYSNNNTNQQLFNRGDYGIINSEDNFVDFLSLFYCSEVTSTSVTLISIELQINTIVQPSVDIRGDLRIKGDTYFHNNNTNTDFVSIDTNDSFVGIGTNVRYVNYNYNSITTTNNDLSKHNFIVSGEYYPVAVVERLAEIKPERDEITNNIINYPDSELGYFTNRAALVCRRKSDYYNIKELYNYSNKYTEIQLHGPYKDQIQEFKYGIDLAFEIQDSSNVSTDLGTIHMVIDDIDETNNLILPGFGIELADHFADGSSSGRKVMYINNEGIMNVYKIKLGMDNVNQNNNIFLSAKDNDLLINNTSLQTIINNEIQKMFSVDTDGKLNIKYNGDTYICEKK